MSVLPLPLPKLTSASFSTTRRQINKHAAVKYKLEYLPTLSDLFIGVRVLVLVVCWRVDIGIGRYWREVVLFLGSTSALVFWHWYLQMFLSV